MIASNLHTHTTFSDGANTPEEMIEKAKENNIQLKNKAWVYIITAAIFPILPLNIISLAVLQHDVNAF